MTCPTVAASRSAWVVELLRRFVPVVRERMPFASYAEVAGLIVEASNVALDTGRDIEACVAESVAARVGK